MPKYLCPAEPIEIAEKYCLHQLHEREARAFELHSATCDRCADAVRTAWEFIAAVKGATADN